MKVRRIAVIGSGGRLGAALARHFAPRHEILALARPDIDLASPDSIRAALEPARFDLVLNAAALTGVDHCERHEDEADRINAHAVELISRICVAKRARLIHFSTDYVFDGRASQPYTESDPPEPINAYARSKLRGEQAMLAVSPDHLAVRISWLYGPDRPSFIDWLVSDAMEKEDVAAVADKFATPTYSVDLAANLETLLALDFPGGILHIPNSGSCSWCQYGEEALRLAAEAGLPLRTTRVRPLGLAELPAFIAPRPVYTVLSPELFARLTGVTPRPWQVALRDHVRDHIAPRLASGVRVHPPNPPS